MSCPDKNSDWCAFKNERILRKLELSKEVSIIRFYT